MKLYVGNLSYTTTQEALRAKFEEFGSVDEATVITDRDSGRPRGFGFVEMPNAEEANRAIAEVNNAVLDGRTLRVNEARPRRQADGGGGGGGGRGRRSRW